MCDSGWTRREALSTVAAAAAVTACGGLGGCELAPQKKALITSGLVSIGPAGDYPAGTASTRYLDTYGIVIVNESGTVLAIRPKCTHKGCIAKWNPKSDQFECPCHGSRFDLLGRPVHGPATRPLPEVVAEPTGQAGEVTLSVDLTKLYSL